MTKLRRRNREYCIQKIRFVKIKKGKSKLAAFDSSSRANLSLSLSLKANPFRPLPPSFALSLSTPRARPDPRLARAPVGRIAANLLFPYVIALTASFYLFLLLRFSSRVFIFFVAYISRSSLDFCSVKVAK